MKTQPSKFRVTQVLTCFAVFISAYTLGCFTIKRELFPYDLYKSWRKSGQQHESLPQKIEHYGDIPGFGIEFISKPEFIEIKKNLSIEDLTKGGYVIVIRHTLRDHKEGPKLWEMDRVGQAGVGASLNPQGVADAEVINEVIKSCQIPIGQVYSSPSHRTRQLAEIAFGSKSPMEKLALIYQPMMRIGEKCFFDIELVKLLSEPIEDGKNRILSAHNNTLERLGIEGLPQQKLEQGDAAIILPKGELAFKYIGTIKIEEWLEHLK